MSRNNVVYLVRANGLYKIGTTHRQLTDRCSEIASTIGTPVQLIHSFGSLSGRLVEAALHSRFADRRTLGEWFALKEADVTLILAVARCDSVEDLPESLRAGDTKIPARIGSEADVRFGESLKRLRESRGMTRYRLAKDAGVSQITLTRMEAGGRTATVPTLCRLADVLDCTLDELCGRMRSAD